MTILQITGRYIVFLSVFMSVLQVTTVTAQNKKDGVTVSYQSSGPSRVARFKNSNSYHVRVEFSYNGTKVHGSAETSGQDAVFCTSQLFGHVWWPWDFRHVGPDHSCYAVGLGLANAITVVFDEKSGRFDADVSRFRKNWRDEVFFA